jgi:hypothetical protein
MRFLFVLLIPVISIFAQSSQPPITEFSHVISPAQLSLSKWLHFDRRRDFDRKRDIKFTDFIQRWKFRKDAWWSVSCNWDKSEWKLCVAR